MIKKLLFALFFFFSFLPGWSQCDSDPGLSISASKTEICDGEAISFQSQLNNAQGWSTTYQWQLNNSDLAGKTESSLSLNNLSDGDVIKLEVVVKCETNSHTIYSNSIKIDVIPLPRINPINDITICNGQPVNTINFPGEGISSDMHIEWTNSDTRIGLPANGSGNIASFSASNTTSSPINANISVTSYNGSCEGNTVDFTITVNPAPKVDQVTDFTLCNGETFSSLNFSGNSVPGMTYQWQNSTTSIGLSPSGTGDIPYFTAINNGKEPVNATIRVTPEANSCEGETKSFTITVNPTPIVEQPANIVVCEGETLNRYDFEGNTVSGTTVTWTNDNPAIGLSDSGQNFVPQFVSKNDTSNSIFATITLSPSANGCTGEPVSFTIEVKPKPAFVVPADQEFCSGIATSSISLESEIANTTYQISGGSSIGLNDKNSATEIPSFTPVNNTNQPKTVQVEITPHVNGCTGETKSFSITVNPIPNVSISPSSLSLCSGETTNLQLSGNVNNSSFNWTIDEVSNNISGASDGNGTAIIQTLTNNSTTSGYVVYKVSPSTDSCSGTPIKVKVTVNPLPVLVITDPETICSPAEIDLTLPQYVENSTPNLTYTYWKDQQATSPVNDPTKVGVGTYYIKGESDSGCETIAAIQVTEFPSPSLTSNKSIPGICSGTAVIYDFESDVPDTEFTWSRPTIVGISTPANTDSGSIDEILVNTTNHPIEVVYEITMKSPDGCITTDHITTTVTPTPVLDSSQSLSPICSESDFLYTPSSTTTQTNFAWKREAVAGIENAPATGNGTISESLINNTTRIIPVTYQYTLSSNNCENPQIFTVTVPVLPAPNTLAWIAKNNDIQKSDQVEICLGQSIDLFSETSLPNNPEVDEQLLSADFNSGNQGWATTNGNQRWNRVGNGEIIDQNCEYVFVGPWPWNYDYQCNDVHAHSNDNSSFFLVNSSSANGNFNDVTLTSPKFSTEGYSSLNLSFWHYYRDGGNRRNNPRDIGRIEYRIGNGSWRSLNNIDFTSSEGGPDNFEKKTYDITALIDQPEVQIRFNYDQANSDYYWAIDNISIFGEGAAKPEVQWTADTSSWTSTEENPQDLTPSETTVYTVTYKDPVNGCPGSAAVKVIVKNPPQPVIKADYCAYPNAPNKIKIYVEGNYDSYQWTSGGQVLGSSSSIDVTSAQGYTVTVWDGDCQGSSSIDISENLITNGDFESGNTGFITQYGFRNNNPNNRDELKPEGLYAVDSDAHEYHDDFYDHGDHTSGDGNYMIVNGDPNLGNVVWETTGYLDVKQNTDYYFSAWTTNLVYRTEENKYARLRLILLSPDANGTDQIVSESTLGELAGVDVGQWIEFYNASVWNSGDHSKVKIQIINENPIRDGNDFGIDDIAFAEINSVAFEFNPQNDGPVCEGGTINLFANLQGGREPIEYHWEGPNGYTSDEANPILENVTLDQAGEYTLQISDFYGCNNTIKSTQLEVVPKTLVNAGEDQQTCSTGAEFSLSGEVSGSVTTGSWSGGNGNFQPTASALDALYIPSEEEIQQGFAELILTSETPEICSAVSDTIRLTITPSPKIDTVSVVNTTCYSGDDGKASLTISSGTAPFSYQWSNGSTQDSVEGLTAGEYSVTVTDARGCSTIKDFTIKSPPALEILHTEFTNVTCYGGSDGSATFEFAGGFMKDASKEYEVKILDSVGNELFSENNTTGQFSVNTLDEGNYLFSVNTATGCVNQTVPFTITQPEEIIVDAGEIESLEDCGVTSVNLNALPVDSALGEGSWKIISGENGHFEDASNPKTIFRGTPNSSYHIAWTVIPANGCPKLQDTLDISFPGNCSKLDFDGHDDYAFLGNNYNLNSAFSIEIWIKPHGLNGTILSKRISESDKTSGYDLRLDNGKPVFSINKTKIASSFKISTERWYHLAVTYDGTSLNLFIDGINVKSVSSEAAKQNDAPLLLGAVYDEKNPNTPSDYYFGWMQELRIWNTALSEKQLHFMMNQKITSNSGKVKGEILPMNVPEDLSWNKLAGYYRLLTDEVNDGFSPDISASKVDAELRNIQTNQENTAPLPYILYDKGNNLWYDKNTWVLPENLNGHYIQQQHVWDPPNSIGVKPSEKIEWNIVILPESIRNEATTNNKNQIKLLGLISEKGMLNMEGENNFSGNALWLTQYLRLDGAIDLNGESQLLQSEGSILENSSQGYIEKDQQGTRNSFNYNYWTSPVSYQGKDNNSGFDIETVLYDGSNPENPKDISFSYNYTYADYNYSGALRISSYWLFTFHGTANSYGEWSQFEPDTPLQVGEGYSMKGTHGWAPIKELQNYVFIGKPNNGEIKNLSISNNENRLIGNPYPSMIDSKEFILDNLQNVTNGRNKRNVFNGSLYFWDHFGNKNTHILAEYVGGYATLNLSGGVQAVSNDERIHATGQKSSKIPSKEIAVGQGFFVNTVQDGNKGPNFSVDGGDIIFKNSQRVYHRENPGNTSFLAPVQMMKKSKGTESDADQRQKIRLMYDSPKGYHRQILVTADENTSMGMDLGYDAPQIDQNDEDMYWLINDQAFVIQGIHDFGGDKELDLGINVGSQEEFTIRIDSLENWPGKKIIYLKDKQLDSIHNLMNAPYITSSDSLKKLTDRFVVLFKNPTETSPENGDGGNNSPNLESTISVKYNFKTNELLIENPKEKKISHVYIFDLRGKLIEDFNEESTAKLKVYEPDLRTTGVYIVKVIAENQTINKMIIRP